MYSKTKHRHVDSRDIGFKLDLQSSRLDLPDLVEDP